jgi:5-methyltetrahydropteroyltriglutamate--homocysteine methyltransferase
LRAAVNNIVRRQVSTGIDIVNDGEVSKPSYATYVVERLAGFTGEHVPRRPRRGYDKFPEFAAKRWGDPRASAAFSNPSCDGPVAYTGFSKLRADIRNQRTALTGAHEARAFMSAASPGVIEMFMANNFYASPEEYLFALADAMKSEYDEIHRAGFTLQLDCPDLAIGWAHEPEVSLKEFRSTIQLRLEALNYATRDIPPGSLRLHVCWGNYEAPHHTDIPLVDIIDLILGARPAAISFEGANPRHAHEWKVFEELKLPEGKVIIPGVIDTTTHYIEHPELVAQRLISYANAVGRENLIAGTDCGFATFADHPIIDAEVAWAKLATLVDGAWVASGRLWGRALPRLAADSIPIIRPEGIPVRLKRIRGGDRREPGLDPGSIDHRPDDAEVRRLAVTIAGFLGCLPIPDTVAHNRIGKQHARPIPVQSETEPEILAPRDSWPSAHGQRCRPAGDDRVRVKCERYFPAAFELANLEASGAMRKMRASLAVSSLNVSSEPARGAAP